MERLSSLDGVFLAAEDDRNHMNIGTLAIFAGPAPPLAEIRAFLAARLSRVPRCRQRVHEPTGPLGRPVWVDDDGFDIDRHVRAVDRAGGSPPDLDALVADLLARPLDRSRPLWEVWVVSDGPDEQWALIAKVHHCLADGIAGSDLLGAVLTTAPDPVPPSPPPWTPAPEPAAGAYLRFGVRTALRSLTARVRGALTMLRHPVRTGRRARAVARAARRLWYRQLRPVTSLTGPIGETRRWAHGALSRDEIDEIRRTLGGTVNDVVVAAVTLGLRDLLVARDEPVADRTVTAMIPVSLRAPSDRGRTGNELANVHAELPVGTADPRNVLRAVHDHIEELKRSHEVDATGLLLRIGDYTPRVLANRVVREVLHRQRSVETVITDVPGPPARLFLGDRPLLAGYPVAPIAGRVRMCVALWSYCGTLGIGVTGDRDSAPDVAELARGIERGVAALLGTARDA